MSSVFTRFLIGIAAVLALCATSTTAFGQFGGWGGGEGSRLSREQIEQYGTLLGLDETQREIAQMMLEEYLDGAQTVMDTVREAADKARQEFEETRDRSVWAGMREVQEAARERVDTLEDQFMGDLRMMLSPEQDEAWPRVERAHRRAKSLPRGLMSGERVDLFEVVRGLELEGEASGAAKTLLNDYELALDRVLITRDQMYEQGMAMFRERDFEALQSHFEDARDAAIRVRDVHRTFARRLEGVVPGEKLDAMRGAIQRASFPSVYRENRSDRAMAFVKDIEGLTDDQRSRFDAIMTETSRRMAQVNRQIADAIESNEVNMGIRDLMRGGRRGNEAGTREMFAEKREVIDRAIDQLRTMLSEEQAAAFDEAVGSPEEAERDGGRRGGNRDGGRGQRQRAPQRL